ncbi:MAG: 16S rRNA (cytosine(1402)-N(4))-methyltransferase RsmH [Bacteroidales bacterium]|nr:16S rRNA (cytosine(1402)-N(4))-methyltransferase RsmH [Bacteroidales bacterium]
MTAYHIPVLLQESIEALLLKPEGVYVDATFGGGGHSRAILERLSPKGRLIAFDKDTDALAQAPADKRLILVHNNFRFVHNFVRYHGYPQVDGILADLGVSSHQFDTGERGFSFRFDAPLDMRMNTRAGRTAADLVNDAGENDLERIFRLYGEVENSRRAAALVVKARESAPIRTTGDLARALESILPKMAEHKYLAKVFQALRIEVNGELEDLDGFLQGAIRSLKPGGRIAVITYHSLEDRLVKNYFKSGNATGEIQRDLMGRGASPLESVERKPILPREEEIAGNTRARSAKLRVARRTDA